MPDCALGAEIRAFRLDTLRQAATSSTRAPACRGSPRPLRRARGSTFVEPRGPVFQGGGRAQAKTASLRHLHQERSGPGPWRRPAECPPPWLRLCPDFTDLAGKFLRARSLVQPETLASRSLTLSQAAISGSGFAPFATGTPTRRHKAASQIRYATFRIMDIAVG